MGMFGVGEIFYNLEKVLKTELVTRKVTISGRRSRTGRFQVGRDPGSLIGFFIGILPGGGAVISSWSLMRWKREFPRPPRNSAKGHPGGGGSGSANNAAASASFIPLLTLGIPGNAAIAMILPPSSSRGSSRSFPDHREAGDLLGVVASMYIGNVMLLILNLPMVGIWVQLLRVPYSILARSSSSSAVSAFTASAIRSLIFT